MNNIPFHRLIRYGGEIIPLNYQKRYGEDCYFHFVNPFSNAHLVGYSLFLIDHNGLILEPGVESTAFDCMEFDEQNGDTLKIIGVDIL